MGRRSTKEPKVPLAYEKAPMADEIVDDLVEKYHGNLKEARISCHFTNRPMYDKGTRVFGLAKKCSGFGAYLANKPMSGTFEIVLDGSAWINMSEELRAFVLDDALCGLDRNDKGKLSFKAGTKVHMAAVKRHGLITDELKFLGRTVSSLQPALALEEGGISEKQAEEFTGNTKPKGQRREKAVAAGAPA